jgi:hypothetical protein
MNPFAKRLNEASVLLEGTLHPELVEILRLGAEEIQRLQLIVERRPLPPSDLVRRLENLGHQHPTCTEGAWELERLRSNLALTRASIKGIADGMEQTNSHPESLATLRSVLLLTADGADDAAH